MRISKKIIALLLIFTMMIGIAQPEKYVQADAHVEPASGISQQAHQEEINLYSLLEEQLENADYIQLLSAARQIKEELQIQKAAFSREITKSLQNAAEDGALSDRLRETEATHMQRFAAVQQNLSELEMLLSSSDTYEYGHIKVLVQQIEESMAQPENPGLGLSPYEPESFTPETIPVGELTDDPPGELPEPQGNWLAGTDETALTDEMKTLADSLHTPLAIYSYIKNNIIYEPYYGSRKGATGTFEQHGGNDIDQASLLVAMLRYKEVPARYVTGIVSVTPAQAIALTGAETVQDAALTLTNNGRPVTNVLSDEEEILSIRLEQTWAEAFIHDSWIALDPSFKAWEYIGDILNPIEPILNSPEVQALPKVQETDEDGNILGWNAEAAQQQFSAISEMAYAQGLMEQETYITSRKVAQEELSALPSALPYTVVSAQETYQQVTDAQSDTVTIIMDTINETFKTAVIYGKRVSFVFPFTDSSYSQLDYWGGMKETPAYCLYTNPVLKIDNEVYAQSSSEAQFGSKMEYSITLKSGLEERTVGNTIAAGGIYSLIFDLQNISYNQIDRAEQKLTALSTQMKQALGESDYEAIPIRTLEDFLYNDEYAGELTNYAGLMYFAQLDLENKALSEVSDVLISRSVSFAMTGYTPQIEYLLSLPQTCAGHGLFIDVQSNTLNAHSVRGDSKDEFTFYLSAGMRSCALESETWSIFTGERGVSSLEILQAAQDQGIATAVITPETCAADLKKLDLISSLKTTIQEETAKGNYVICHSGNVTIDQWTGYGYIVLNPETGRGSYMISGGLNGGYGNPWIDLAALANIIGGIVDIIGSWQIIKWGIALMAAHPIIGGVIIGFGALSMIMGTVWIYDNVALYSDYLNGNAAAGREILANTVAMAAGAALGFAAGAAGRKLATSKMVRDLIKGGMSREFAEQLSRKFGLNDLNILKKLLKDGADAKTVTEAITKLGRRAFRYGNDFYGNMARSTRAVRNKVYDGIAKYGDDFARSFGKYGDPFLNMVNRFGDAGYTAAKNFGDVPGFLNKVLNSNAGGDMVSYANTYGRKAAQAFGNYGDKAANLIRNYGKKAGDVLKYYGDKTAFIDKLVNSSMPKDMIDYTYSHGIYQFFADYGDDGVRVVKQYFGAAKAIRNNGSVSGYTRNLMNSQYKQEYVYYSDKYGYNMVKAFADYGDEAVSITARYGDNGAAVLKANSGKTRQVIDLINQGEIVYDPFLKNAASTSDAVSIMSDVLSKNQLAKNDAARLASQFTKEPQRTKVVLGKMNYGGIGYVEVAKQKSATYFQMNDPQWNSCVQQYGQVNVWEINKAFIDQQISAGKEIFLSHNPYSSQTRTGFYKLELEYLESRGYTFIKDGTYWRGVK